ncbi:hypothetical protein Achl_2291 [Pseudarthrobacter chlorophenolicus A6]|uniref:Uncharacterized protein n=1 Tax=Pseudarthrobacter chlorophenolicus (strain ATCC 700700 / DSM 12829 / CIP 107037 / JCM 12360 / KCTC 9906 / NCIMB 13794 / A6) TaxID=452863 RepID=B8HAU2_PSECP|nr:hypothetical protein [Pseudarthrobacter chlorophenolicus]ACL40256.1 hypothetical protein Achl_2291 [Pseudarthrobacter chlorophenolicus A6]SDQ84861.1 hypothetical protein SAMN04489738_3197 [Pseudarthrobacter chlorophenolicus]
MEVEGTAAVPVRGRAQAGSLIVLTVGALLLAGCSGPQAGGSGAGWTAQAEPSAGAAGAPATAPSGTTPPGGLPGPSGEAGATGTASADPRPAATAATWKTFADPARTVSFELPQDWIAQSVQAEDGTLPGALKIEVKKPDGTFMAALRTGLPPSSAECPEGSRRPYTVISSVPASPAASAGTGEGTIPPRVVFRVIQGYRYFGSYGITNVVGGAGNQACELRNTVSGPAGKGDWSFGDLVALKAFAPDEKVAPAKAFDTLGAAAAYAGESPDFANVQRMLMSLEIKN